MLAAIGDLGVEGLFVLKDFAAQLTTPAVSRAFRELLERFAGPGRLSTIVLIGASLELPAEVDPQVVRYELRLPDREEYRAAIATVVESLQANRRAEVALGPADYDDFATALSGLGINQARQAVAQAAIEDGQLDRDDVAKVVELKARALRDDGLLEYFPPADNRYELGGFAGLKRWLDRARIAFTPEAAAAQPDPAARRDARRRAGLRQIARGEGDRAPLGAAAAQARRRPALRQVRRRVRAELPPRDRGGRGDGARACCGSTRSRRASPPAAAATPTADCRSGCSARS